MTKKTINIAKEFCIAPAGRFKKNADYSGEKFREEFLVPAFQDNTFGSIEVVLDNLEGVGSSFWEEAFGGLIRVENISYNDIKNKLRLKCEDDITLAPLIESFLEQATKKK
ncbi:STAS-like domain-containing protein [Flavobacteriaceae bacterium]|nr:STAS-like domain-containing protein [Flavobacteriaceae bacterium]